ncbi:hypothetical protein MNBD_GAMMA07-1063 [hydrothermal vent metagenome]|uniref:FIGfam010717 n=1 Tax=hydrothermal vent metagenome TaxID=652676 RepID=A0A3B0WVU2_9ZZZZ
MTVNIKSVANIGILLTILTSSVSAGNLFGYQESGRENLKMFPQWLSVLERNIQQMVPKGQCESRAFNQCHVKQWLAFLNSIQSLTKIEQINKVNIYANEHDYILDIENYGMSDYWATPKEFLINSGDCEDYAIIKMLSLKMLGFDMGNIRLVVLQDTNLRIPHAILAVNVNQDVLIMDNQVNEVVSHNKIIHYVPVYAVNEKKWWMFYPE